MSNEDVTICITKEDLHNALINTIRDYYNVFNLTHTEKCLLDNFVKLTVGMDDGGLGESLFIELESVLREKESEEE